MQRGALFISHASADEATVSEIVAYLEGQGVPCWISFRDIPPRSIYAEAIAQGIQECSACAVVVSAAANSSDAIKREVELASHYRKPFIPIRIDTSQVGPGLDYYLRNTQWLDYARHGSAALERIVGDLRNALEEADPAQPSMQPDRTVEVSSDTQGASRSTPASPGGPSPQARDQSAAAQREEAQVESGGRPTASRQSKSPLAARLANLAIPVTIAAAVVGLLAVLWLMNSTPRQVSYPPQYETNFMNACQTQGSTPARCACIWDRIEANIDPNSFAALEQLPGPEREAHPLMQQIQRYTLECPSVPASGVEPAPGP